MAYDFMDEFMHSGVAHDENPPGRGSGRYPFGSGDNPAQHQFTFLSEVDKLRKQGLTESEIAKALLGKKGVDKNGEPIWSNSTDLRAEISIANADVKRTLRSQAQKLYDEYGNKSEVARIMGINESTVRSFLNPILTERNDKYQNTADVLRKKIEEKGFIDISSGVEDILGVPDHTKKVAAAILEREGYVKTWIQLDQQFGNGKKTTITVLARKPEEGETEKDVRSWVQKNKANVGSITEFTPDQGHTWWTPEFPAMLDSKRVMVRYAEDGGKDKDGVIELRRGVEDISLGNSQYAQVRIGLDGTNYLKGMAMYGNDEDFPEGIDVIFNTNKGRGTPLIDKTAVYDPEEDNWSGKEVSKRLKINPKTGEVDEGNPFGALIKNPKEVDGVVMAGGQRHYVDKDGNLKLSPINKLRDEGDWDSWSRTLSAQFLSKQPLKLIKQQLDLSVAEKRVELDKIMSLTNPVIRQKLLFDFAEQTDSLATHLKANAFKNQAFQVLLPVPSMKEDEVYAPNYKDGDIVALVRYPHGGTFEIPVLKVNNHVSAAEKVMGNAKDAVGIHPKVAERLSGADFDGDTVLVIPMKSNNIKIQTHDPLPELKDWDPKEKYSLPGKSTMKTSTKGRLMGETTNLITDMTVAGANWHEIARAVQHSMVVIDAQKHNLDYKASAKDFRIDELKRKYQSDGGASTILSRAKSPRYINQRKEVTDPKRMTPEQLDWFNQGGKVFVETGKTKMKLISDPKKMTDDELKRYKSGKKVYRETDELVQEKVPRMETVRDAFELVQDPSNEKEVAYANYANDLMAIGREARKEARQFKPTPVNKESAKTYAKEVASLKEKLHNVNMNKPRERQAQALAGIMTSEVFASNPGMDYEHRQRERARALTQARATVGAKKNLIPITDSEWDAIQANAVSSNLLRSILDNTDQDKFRQRATPRERKTLSPALIDFARAMASTGRYTNAEIAERCGVSSSTIVKILG